MIADMNNTVENSITLGRTDLRVSPIGVGTNRWGVRRQADPARREAFDALAAAGISLFDTAEIYTLGASELTIGRCIKESGHRPTVLTKFFPMPWRLGKDSLRAALKRSLARLQLPQVDVYLLHFPLGPVPLETWVNALADVAKEGLTRAVGISNCNLEQTRRAHAVLSARGVPLACNEVEYSLLKRGPEKSGLLSLCHELGTTLIAYRPLASGALAGIGAGATDARRRPLVDAVKRIGQSHGKSSSQVAINWVVCKGALPIPGARDARHAQENAGAMGWRLTPAEVAELDSASPAG
jgi:aryl-alcohol dehydrogenase-like predicted oxidoreductase